jgi:hypothetical protein
VCGACKHRVHPKRSSSQAGIELGRSQSTVQAALPGGTAGCTHKGSIMFAWNLPAFTKVLYFQMIQLAHCMFRMLALFPCHRFSTRQAGSAQAGAAVPSAPHIRPGRVLQSPSARATSAGAEAREVEGVGGGAAARFSPRQRPPRQPAPKRVRSKV